MEETQGVRLKADIKRSFAVVPFSKTTIDDRTDVVHGVTA